jgi:hypothetical protein
MKKRIFLCIFLIFLFYNICAIACINNWIGLSTLSFACMFLSLIVLEKD